MTVWRELLARAVLAALGIPLLCVVGWLGGWWWYALVLGATVIGLGEFYSACFAKGFRPPAMLCYFSAAALLFAASFGEEQAGLLMAVIGFCTAIAVALRCLLPPRREYLGTVASAVLGLVYIAGGMTFLSLLRSVDVPAAVGTVGAWSFARRMGAVLLVLLPVWASDTGAFLAGGLWGHHRLAPVLSPNKTVEGAIGGFISTLLATLLLGAGWLKLPVGASLILGSAVGVACQLGDLVESAIKRDLGLKDFGVIFGPHGGLLDRFDGLLLAMPAGYAVLWLVLGPNAFTGHI